MYSNMQGAVYQYHDSTGRAKLVGSTAELPERAFRRDMLNSTEVAKLLSGDNFNTSSFGVGGGDGNSRSRKEDLSAGSNSQIVSKRNGSGGGGGGGGGGGRMDGRPIGGRTQVVWAGVGRKIAGLGDYEMAMVRDQVAEARAGRLHLRKLESIKPYSRHA